MKTFGKTLMIAASAAVLASTVPVLAQSGGPAAKPGEGARPMPFLTAADTNGDGAISREEANAFHAQRFAETDLNGDGVITQDEMASMRSQKMGPRDGRPGPRGMDGMKAGHHGMKGKHGGGHHDGRRGDATAHLQRLLEMMDTDGSGAVSQEELLARFNELDTNKDGVVTVAEARDGLRAAMRAARGPANAPQQTQTGVNTAK